MGRRSSIDRHPQRELIEEHLINETMSMAEIIDKFSIPGYKITLSGLTWHRDEKMRPMIEKAKKKTQITVDQQLKTLEHSAISIMESQVQKWMDGEEKMTSKTALDFLKAIQKFRGETEDEKEIEINFGYGTDKRKESPRFRRVDAEGKIIEQP